MAGSRAYAACDLYGIGILDVSNPADADAAPARYKTRGQAHAVEVFGKTALDLRSHVGRGLRRHLERGEAGPARLGVPRGLLSVPCGLRLVGVRGGFSRGLLCSRSGETGADPLGAVQTADADYGRIISIGVSDPSDTKGPKIAAVSGGRALHVYDVSNPAAPVLLTRYATPGRGPRMAMKGRLAYVADNAEGVQVVDLSTPSKPRIVATYKTAKPAIDVAVADSLVFVVVGHSWNEMRRRFEGDEVLILRQNP